MGKVAKNTNSFLDLGPRESMIVLVPSVHKLSVPFTEVEEELRAFCRPLFLGNVDPPVRDICLVHVDRTKKKKSTWLEYEDNMIQ